MRHLFRVVLLVSAVTFALHAQAPTSSGTPLTNKDILDLLEAGVGQDVIVAKIKTSTSNFDTSPAALKELKSRAVPDPIVLEMVQRGPEETDSRNRRSHR